MIQSHNAVLSDIPQDIIEQEKQNVEQCVAHITFCVKKSRKYKHIDICL